MNLGTAFVEIRPDVSGFGRQLDSGVTSQAESVGRQAGRRFSDTFRNAVRGLGAAVIGRQLLTFLGSTITEAEEAQRVLAQTKAVIESTGGVANVSATDLADYAERLSDIAAVDDELIQSAGNVLLTFTRVRNEVGEGNDVYDQALASALDLSAALGTDLQGATILVGKALNDPIRGLTSLTRAGVQFTDEQKRAIETALFFGDTLGAQKIILEELEAQFGGSAEAGVTASAEWQTGVDDLKESIGESLLPVMTDLVDKANEVMDKFRELDSETRNVIIIVGGIAVAFLLLAVAVGAFAALVVVLLGVVVGGVVWLVANVDELRLAFENLWNNAMRYLADLSTNRFPILGSAINAIATPLQAGLGLMQQIGGVVLSGIQGQFSGLRNVISTAADVARNFHTFVRFIANSRVGPLGFDSLRSFISTALDGARTLASVIRNMPSLPSFNFPSLPGRATGGPIGRGMTMVGERGPELLFADRAAYVASTQDTARMMRGDGVGAGIGLVEEVRGLRRDLNSLRLTVDTRELALATAAGNRPAERGSRGLRGNGL